MKYDKSPLNVEQQIKLLQSRGMQFDDIDYAGSILSNISYYRLSSYIFPYRKYRNNSEYYDNLSFELVMKHYSFDRKLRLLIFDAIERIEIAFRTQLTLNFVFSMGNFWYSDINNFQKENIFNKIMKSFSKEIDNSNEVFIEHFKTKYNESKYPPSWIALEIFTFGQLSHHYSNLVSKREKQKVADVYDLKYPVLESWMHSLSYVRNLCAHHSRLWNRNLGVKPVFPSKKNFNFLKYQNIRNDKLYYSLSIIRYILNKVHKENNFHIELKKLLLKYPEIKISKMGFPDNWEEEKLWK